ncbi:MAG: glycosyltransferase family 2 protein [Bacteroidota bacterium]
MDKIAVVILNWNGKELLNKYLPSVVKFSNGSGISIYLADNFSDDESISYVSNTFPSVKILELDKNYGFAEGYNIALKDIEAEHYILLNSDIEVTKDWFEPLLNCMESQPDVAACMPKIISDEKRDEFEYAGAAGGYIDKYGFPFCRGRLFNMNEKDTGQYNYSSEIFWATGACMMIRADLFHRAGGLDKDFFAHMEEIDLCWRLKNQGYKIYYCHESTVYHLGGGTLKKTNPRKTYLNFRNNLFLIYKNAAPEKVNKMLFIRFIIDGIAAIKFLFSFEFTNFVSVFKAHVSFYSKLKIFRPKRRQNLKSFKIFKHKEIYKKSIVYSFFVKKIKKFSDLKFDNY